MRPLAPLRARERAIRTPALPITDPAPREALVAAIWARAMPADACPGREYLARRVCHGSSPCGRGTLQLQAIDMQRVYSL